MTDSLTLKWGTLKAWDLRSDAALAAAKKYDEAGEMAVSAMLHYDSDEQKAALCDLIDAVDCETIYNDWSGEEMTKDEAKRYVREYGRK